MLKGHGKYNLRASNMEQVRLGNFIFRTARKTLQIIEGREVQDHREVPVGHTEAVSEAISRIWNVQDFSKC